MRVAIPLGKSRDQPIFHFLEDRYQCHWETSFLYGERVVLENTNNRKTALTTGICWKDGGSFFLNKQGIEAFNKWECRDTEVVDHMHPIFHRLCAELLIKFGDFNSFKAIILQRIKIEGLPPEYYDDVIHSFCYKNSLFKSWYESTLTAVTEEVTAEVIAELKDTSD